MDPAALGALEFDRVLAIVARHAAGPLGADAARSAAPTGDARAIAVALAEVEEIARISEAGEGLPLADAGDPRPALERLAEGSRPLEPKELLAVARLLAASDAVGDAIESQAGAAPALARRIEGLARFGELRAAIAKTVDDDGSIPDRASAKLARLRGEMASLDREIAGRIAAFVGRASIRPHLQSGKPVLRDGRYLVAVKSEARGRVPGLLHERSASGATIFVEPKDLVEPGNRLAELRTQESREVAAVLLEATRRLLARRRELEDACARLAALDLAFAKARYARATFASIPRVGDGRSLDLRDARHPLLLDAVAARVPRTPEAVVPISIRLGADFDLLLLTGPNTGGKTVALKTAGLLAAMALAGFPVPAAPGARVPVYDALFVDIGDEQEIAQSLSTFSSHLRRLAPALAGATERSLVLLDELGAGTDPAEGAALARAILEHLLARRASVLATTHLGPLKSLAYVHPRAENGSVEFDSKTLRPLYRLRIGLPGESNALAVARRLGLPEAVVARAEASLAKESHPLDEAIEEVRERRVEAEEARDAALRLRDEAAEARTVVEEERKRTEERRIAVAAEADRAIGDALRAARDAIEEEVARADGAVRERLERLRARLHEAMRGTSLGERRLEFLRRLRKDDLVYLRRFRQRCPVRKVDFEREVLSVQVGRVRMDVPFEEVTPAEPGEPIG